MAVSFLPNVILGKEEEVRVNINSKSSCKDLDEVYHENYESIYVGIFFRDLLGSEYDEEFIIKSEVILENKEKSIDKFEL